MTANIVPDSQRVSSAVMNCQVEIKDCAGEFNEFLSA